MQQSHLTAPCCPATCPLPWRFRLHNQGWRHSFGMKRSWASGHRAIVHARAIVSLQQICDHSKITVKISGGRDRSRSQPESLFRPLHRGVSSGRSPLISPYRHLSAIAPRHLSEPRTVDPNLALLNFCCSLRSTWDFSQWPSARRTEPRPGSP